MNMAVSSPVVRPFAAEFPEATTILAPRKEMAMMQEYTVSCIRGLLIAISFSALEKSL